MEDDVEVSGFFSKRAKFVPQLSFETLEAAEKLIEQLNEGKEKNLVTEDTQPVPAKRGRRKASAKSKCDKPEEITLTDDSQNSFSSPLRLSAASKRRIKRLERKCDREIKRIEAANNKVLSSLNVSSIKEVENEDNCEDVDNCQEERLLTILYLSEVSRMKYYKNESFSAIFPRVADLFKLNISEFLLCVKDKNIKIEDTPESLNLVDSDIIECIPYKATGNKIAGCDDNNLKLLFQASDVKERTEMFVHKLEKMQDIMERYSKTRNIPLHRMVFEFDGEKISGTETPDDMDMESESCIDVKISDSDDKQSRRSKRRNNKTVVDLTVDLSDSDSSHPDIIFCD